MEYIISFIRPYSDDRICQAIKCLNGIFNIIVKYCFPYIKITIVLIFSSVQSLSLVWLFATSWTAAHQAFLSITNSGACSNSCLWSQWCHPTISSSVISFSSHLQSFLASGSFLMSQPFSSQSPSHQRALLFGGQSTGTSPSASVLHMSTPNWFLLGLTGLIS